MKHLAILPILLMLCVSGFAADKNVPEDVADCYMPVEGGWRIRITADPAAPRLKPGEAIGAVGEDDGRHCHKVVGHGIKNRIPDPEGSRAHRRPLYPPADRTLVWSKEELAKHERISFRPHVLAANEPRFLIDLQNAGGLSGHLLLGLSLDHGPSKWLHRFGELDVRYVEGRMEYAVRDAAFPGITVRLAVLPLAESVGMVVKFRVEGAAQPGELLWMFGGASGFTTNYAHSAPQYRFAPDQCAENAIRWENGRFTLLRKGATVMRGSGSSSENVGFGDGKKVMESPAAVAASARWCLPEKSVAEAERVAVQKIRIGKDPVDGWIIIGRGGNVESCMADPGAAEQSARRRNKSIAERIAIQTPDAYLNQAMPMLGFATDGLWGDVAMVHGGWSWRLPYLGWRICYGPVCYGWDDRVRRYIEQHTRLGLIRDGANQGALGHMLEDPQGIYYNMNEVFLDHVRQYFEYTNDVDLLRKVFPVLKGIVAWETRRLQPEKATALYESALDTWISDSHWYIGGQCTTASAYMLGAHQFLAEAAEAVGEDPASYRQKAQAIREAMQKTLWQASRGVFAEYRDTRGAKLLHPEPELASIYHSAEFGAADPLQVYQMAHWVETNLRCESTSDGGKAYWSSNWFPNAGRTQTHSTYDLAYGEQLNLAMTNFAAGRSDEGYALLRGALCGIYNGPTPGGLSCHMFVDGQQRTSNEFADSISMWGRAVAEGMYGIRPKRHRGLVELSPQFPVAWPEASIHTPHFSYRWTRSDGQVTIQWESLVPTSVSLHQALRASSIQSVSADGKPIAHQLDPGVGLTWLNAKTPAAKSGVIRIVYVPSETTPPNPLTWKQGEMAALKLPDYQASDVFDPQGVLQDAKTEDGVVQGRVGGELGARLLFLKSGAACPFWIALTVRVEPKEPVAKRIWSAPKVKPGDLSAWNVVDLIGVFNASLAEVPARVGRASKAPVGAFETNYSYWRTHVDGGYGPDKVANFIPPHPVSDAAWRKKIGPDQIGWTHDGVPFKSAKEGNNIAVVTRAGGFPQKIEVPVNAKGKELYLMLSGMTFPVQSHVVNLKVTLGYEDGTTQSMDLVNPFDIGDCWSTWCGRYHDTAANGFENLAGRFGPPGSAAAGDLTRPIAVDTEAHLVRLPLREAVPLRTLTVEAVANDVIFGLMGASVLK